jgi:hypothetical protein
MKKIGLILAILTLAACSKEMEPQARREQYLNMQASTPAEIASAIRTGALMQGMSKEQVRASWGEPCVKCLGTQQASWGDTWEYNAYGGGTYGIGSGTYVRFDRNGALMSWSKA